MSGPVSGHDDGDNPLGMTDAERAEIEAVAQQEIEVTPKMIAMGAAEIDAVPLLDLAEGWASKEGCGGGYLPRDCGELHGAGPL
jgi:hypothetical protein